MEGGEKKKKIQINESRKQKKEMKDLRFTAATKNSVFWDIEPSSYFTGNTLHLLYRAQPVDAA
jgi:hypothetical protein